MNAHPQFATRRAGDHAARLEMLAADLIDLNAEGDARRQRLIEMGWPTPFLDQYETEARSKANAIFVRDVNDEPIQSLTQLQDSMVEVIRSFFPSTQYVVAELQARGFAVRDIDLFLRKTKARAALSWIHEGVH